MTLTFREATENDFHAIISLHKMQDWGLDTVRALKNFQEQGNKIIVCEENGTILGKMDIMQKKRQGLPFLYLERIIVHPSHRRKGIADKFLAYAETECKKHCLKFVDLTVREDNIPAVSLYKKKGFQELGRKVYMRKEISP